jgi:hypothetical protein
MARITKFSKTDDNTKIVSVLAFCWSSLVMCSWISLIMVIGFGMLDKFTAYIPKSEKYNMRL